MRAMAIEENKATVRRFYAQVLNDGNLDALPELVADDFIENDPLPGQGKGLAGLVQRVCILKSAFPDLRFTIDDVVGEGDKVIVRWTMQGTHLGEFLGVPATGKTAKATGVDIILLRDGQMAEHWHELDALGLLQQIGGIPDS